MSEEIRLHQEEERLLRRLPIWSWYIRGARMMLLRMRDRYLTNEPRPKGFIKDKDDKVLTKAIIDFLLSNKLNIERFLDDGYEIRFTDHEYDKKGKLIKCRAYFAKRVIRYEEV